MSGEPLGPAREAALSDAFVRLADTMVADYDAIDLLTGLSADCVALLGVDTAGLLLADARGVPRAVASSSEEPRFMELYELQADEGPCLDCLRTSARVSATDISRARGRWPRFAPHALEAGFHAVHAVPLRLREETIGALNLFTFVPGELSAPDLHAAQALADVATIGILHERAIRSQEDVTAQLQGALTSRVVIEQAKGVLAERGNLTMAAAFDGLRDHARRTQRRLTDLAGAVVARDADIDAVLRTAVLRAARP